VKSRDAVVIGAGFAGAATAYWLTRLGMRDVLLVEREEFLGRHASGQNAALARKSFVGGAIRPLADEGVRFLTSPPDDFPARDLLRKNGSLLLGSGKEAEQLREEAVSSTDVAGSSSWFDREQVESRVSLTKGADFEGGLFCPDDGVVDIAALLEGYLHAARHRGATLTMGGRLTSIRTENGKITGVEASAGSISTRVVVNAAGAWATEIGELAGGTPISLRPYRRHLVTAESTEPIDSGWPFLWDVTHGIYFRPEPPGLLLSPCDETEQPPGSPDVDRAALELLAEKIGRHFPALRNIRIHRVWAGLRTLSPDGAFVIGRDPRIDGFIWCAGLGGHGMTTSAAVGRLAAEAAMGEAEDPLHSPARFVV